MYKFLFVLVLSTPAIFALDQEALDEIAALPAEAKTGSITVSDSSTSSFLSNAIYVVPVLIAIILVDFAIFGAFASRSDDLNPVSNFFYHVKRGLNIVRDRSSVSSAYTRPHHYNRYQRFDLTQRSKQYQYRKASKPTFVLSGNILDLLRWLDPSWRLSESTRSNTKK